MSSIQRHSMSSMRSGYTTKKRQNTRGRQFRVESLAILSVLLGSASCSVLADSFSVTSTSWGDKDTENTLAWAIDQANQNAGPDVIDINLERGSKIEVGFADVEYPFTFIAQITNDLTINGNGAVLWGDPQYVDQTGAIWGKGTQYPAKKPDRCSDVITANAYSFAALSSEATLNINDLHADGLNTFLSVVTDSVRVEVNLTDVSLKNSVTYSTEFGGGEEGCVKAAGPDSILNFYNATTDSVINLTRVEIDNINQFAEQVQGGEQAWLGVLQGKGQLNMTSSSITGRESTTYGGISWTGQANVVSSIFTGSSGGLWIEEGEMNLVNSLVRFADPLGATTATRSTSRLQASEGGRMNVIASTIQVDAFLLAERNDCKPDQGQIYPCSGTPLRAWSGGVIDLQDSVVSVNNQDQFLPPNDPAYDASGIFSPDGGTFRADAETYISPTSTQSLEALQTLFNQPNLLTGPDFEIDEPFGSFFTYAPLPEGASPTTSGDLFNAVHDADGSNQLINPINDSPLTTDVFGNPRTTNGFRDTGAVQLGLAPTLNLTATGDKLVDLNWSRPLDPSSGAITGYEVCFDTGTAPDPSTLGTDCKDGDGNPGMLETISNAPDTLSGQVTGLTNGDTYWFLVRGVNTEGGGPWSNAVTATPTSSAALDCSTAVPSLDTLWPPNHKLVSLDVEGLTDPAGGSITVSIDGIFQDEPVNGKGDGNTSPDAEGIGTSTASVRAERAGRGNGRVYTLYFTASNGDGAYCKGSVEVGVPKSPEQDAVNDGPWFNSVLN